MTLEWHSDVVGDGEWQPDMEVGFCDAWSMSAWSPAGDGEIWLDYGWTRELERWGEGELEEGPIFLFMESDPWWGEELWFSRCEIRGSGLQGGVICREGGVPEWNADWSADPDASARLRMQWACGDLLRSPRQRW